MYYQQRYIKNELLHALDCLGRRVLPSKERKALMEDLRSISICGEYTPDPQKAQFYQSRISNLGYFKLRAFNAITHAAGIAPHRLMTPKQYARSYPYTFKYKCENRLAEQTETAKMLADFTKLGAFFSVGLTALASILHPTNNPADYYFAAHLTKLTLPCLFLTAACFVGKLAFHVGAVATHLHQAWRLPHVVKRYKENEEQIKTDSTLLHGLFMAPDNLNRLMTAARARKLVALKPNSLTP